MRDDGDRVFIVNVVDMDVYHKGGRRSAFI